MKDIFSEIKKATLRQHMAVGGVALALAIVANTLVFTTDTGVKIQASALEAIGSSTEKTGELLADVALFQAQPGTDRVQVQLQKPAKGVKSIEFSLLTDGESISFGDISAQSGAKVMTSSTLSGVVFVKLNFPVPTDLTPGSIASIATIKKAQKDTPLNISSPRLVTESGEYELSSASTVIR